MTASPVAGSLSFGRRLALGAGDFGFNLYWQTASLFLLYFYTDVVGLSAGTAGTLYMAALVWDAALDPAIGALADRTRSRFGRYRPYLIVGGVPLALSFALMMGLSGSGDRGAVVLTVVLHFGFRTVYAVVSIPYAALFARITRDARQRADMAAIRIFFATCAAVAVAVLTLPLVHALGSPEKPRQGWILLGLVFGTAATLLLFLAAGAARGYDRYEEPGGLPRSLRIELRALFANRALLLLVGALMINAAGGTFFGKNLLYYFKYLLGRADLGGYALGFSAMIVALTVPVFGWISRYLGKREAWLIGMVPGAIGLVLWYLLPVEALTWRFVALGIGALGSAASAVGFWSMLPDTVEYGEWRTGVRTESLVFGVAVFGQKIALGIGAGGLGLALSQIGYVANAEQSAETLDGLRQIMLWLPLWGTLLSAMLIALYPVGLRAHARMVEELAARRLTG